MTSEQQGRPYDLEERTLLFAREVRAFLKTIPRTIANIEDGRQPICSSGSVGANYIEANEALGKKDFKCRLRIARKEAKESSYWLWLLDVGDCDPVEHERQRLVQEANELMKIIAAILRKSE
uniref:Four helix bundle protein n=1 Tax=Schlesneria paludicola TaxID=360056 RepID=A0A7C2JXW8_9PLAN